MTQEPTAPPCPTCGYPRPGAECALCENEILPVDGVKSVRPGRRLFLIEFVEGFVSLFQASLLLMTRTRASWATDQVEDAELSWVRSVIERCWRG